MFLNIFGLCLFFFIKRKINLFSEWVESIEGRFEEALFFFLDLFLDIHSAGVFKQAESLKERKILSVLNLFLLNQKKSVCIPKSPFLGGIRRVADSRHYLLLHYVSRLVFSRGFPMNSFFN